MEISALVNPAPEAPRRSPSNPHSIIARSPATSAAKLPTPPLSITHKAMAHKRKRADPKPVWAILEHELLDGQTLEQYNQRQRSAPPPSTPRPQPQPPPDAHTNGRPPSMGPPPSFVSRELIGLERPITNDGKVYDEISRVVCDFIWNEVIENASMRGAVEQSPGTQVEIEARWGQIIDRQTDQRLMGMHQTECVMRRSYSEATRFESTMSLEQHKKMNLFLNNHSVASQDPKNMRAEVCYEHLKEGDTFYELNQEGFNLLPERIKEIINRLPTRQRIRVTRDLKTGTGTIVRKLIKIKLANLEISSPQTEWDYRIGINLEIDYPGPVEGLQTVVENGKTVESMQRKKDRVSYKWLDAYQIDLTQVIQGQNKIHELELELNSGLILQHGDLIRQGKPNDYEALVAGMMNNMRVLSREVTPVGQQ